MDKTNRTPLVRIGIVLTTLRAEKIKDELVPVKSREWLKNAITAFPTIKNDRKQPCTTADISIGKYIEYNYDNVIVDYIKPEDISLKRFRKNDMNFIIIYDLLECYHLDKTKGRKIFTEFKDAMKDASNMYPPYYYQKFINNKATYINYLSERKAPVIPTYCIMKKMFEKQGLAPVIKKLKTLYGRWGKMIGKPVYGQESNYFKKFDSFNETQISNYIRVGLDKYPGILFQKYITDFDKNKPEVRTYFIDDKYRYSAITSGDKVTFPKTEGGKTDLTCHKKLLGVAKKTITKLPPIHVQGVNLPRLLTRLDIATNVGGCGADLINEVEFVPSLYIEDIKFVPEPWLGDSMVRIVNTFLAKRERH